MSMEILKRGLMASAFLAFGMATACGDSDDTTADGGVNADATTNPDASVTGFQKPAGSIALNFTIDDSANKVYTTADGLAWKGSFKYNKDTRVVEKDAAWGGPFAMLYDDGAWNMGGHEPAGATAGDNKWGIAMFVVPGAAATEFEYGAIRKSVNGSDGEWIWNVPGGNGKFTVAVGASADITATGMALPAFGTTDLRLTINTTTLAAGFEAFMPANGVKVKSSAWGWSEQTMVDDGTKGDVMAADGTFTMVLSEFVGEGKPLGRLVGLLKTGDEAQFVFVLGGVEYKVAGTPPTQGVAVAVKPQGGAFTNVAVDNKPDGDKNTFVVVP